MRDAARARAGGCVRVCNPWHSMYGRLFRVSSCVIVHASTQTHLQSIHVPRSTIPNAHRRQYLIEPVPRPAGHNLGPHALVDVLVARQQAPVWARRRLEPLEVVDLLPLVGRHVVCCLRVYESAVLSDTNSLARMGTAVRPEGGE